MKKENNEIKYPLLEIMKDGRYNLYIDDDVKVVPESKKGFENIVKDKEIIVVYEPIHMRKGKEY